MRQEKRKKRGEEKVSADARTSQANILHLDQKVVMCQGRTWDFLSGAQTPHTFTGVSRKQTGFLV